MARFSRKPTADGHSRASTLELFYDLVFVFAITQVSHYLLDDHFAHLNWAGAGQAAVILLAVWWSWNYTTWATNELDTSAPAVRGLVIAVMLGSLLMSIAIPSAWGERALLFAGAYVAIQVGRHTFLTFASGTKGSNERAAGRPHPHLVLLLGDLLDRRRARRRRSGPHVALACGPGDRLQRAALRLPRPRDEADRRLRLGRGERALLRALPALRDHRPRRVDRRHGRDHLRVRCARVRSRRGIRRRLPRQRGALVALLQPRRRSDGRPSRGRRQSHRAGPRRLHLPPRFRDRGNHRDRGR